MKRLIMIVMFTGLALEISLSAPGTQASPSDQSTPSSQPQTEAAPAAPQTPAQGSPETQPPTPSPPPANRPSHRSTKKKPATKASTPGHKVVVRNGGAKDESAQLAPGMSKEQELHNREKTTQLLATTDANLKSMTGRQLTPTQQGVLDQIHTYIRQSKDASDSGDLARAHTLAYKAHLLSDELMRR